MSNERILINGTTAQRLSVTPAKGQVGSDNDLKKVVLGDGTTVGGILMARDDETAAALANRVRYDAAQTLTAAQKGQAKANIEVDGSLSGLRNYLLNGDFDWTDEATSHTTSGYGSLSQWAHAFVGGSGSLSRQAFTAGQTAVPGNPEYFARVSVTHVVGAGNYHLLRQRVLGTLNLSGLTVTLTFWAKADAAKNIGICLLQNFGSGGSANVDAIGAQKIALTTSWQKYSLVFSVPSVTGKTVGALAWTEVGIWLEAGSTYTTQSADLGQQSGTFDFARVSLIAGDVRSEAVPSAPRTRINLTQDMDACRRFWREIPVSVRAEAPVNSSTFAFGYTWPEMVSTPVPTKSASGTDVVNIAGDAFAMENASGGRYQFTTNTSGGAYVYGSRWRLSARI